MQNLGSPIDGRTRLGRPYLKIGAVIALGVGILAAGILGPHAPASPAASPTHPAGALITSPANQSAPPSLAALLALSGLRQVRPPAASILRSDLPAASGSRYLAVSRGRLFYVDQANILEATVIGSADRTNTLVTVSRCQNIGPLAAAGNELIYAVTWPSDPSRGPTACGHPQMLSWSIWLLDLGTGKTRQVAIGSRPADWADLALSENHLAITASSYAFDRLTDETDPTRGVDIEVHSLAGRLLWRTHSPAAVASIMLGGDRLAVITEIRAATHGSGSNRIAWLSSATAAPMTAVAVPADNAALSNDGTYLIWTFPSDSPGRPDLGIKPVAPTDGFEVIVTFSPSGVIRATDPAVSITSRGPLIAWLATAPDGSAFPAFEFAPDGFPSVLDSVGKPAWIAIEGTVLTWVTANEGGSASEAFAVDLADFARQ